MKTNEIKTSRPAKKLLLSKNGRGEVTGSVQGYWCQSAGRYVTIPSR